ncbi:myc-type, basic helix-loop-helix (bHLH) domain-containing protein [Artemisia annua]|uniref:Myc-type, basic helix-loop-helix (BHLH) domain-containing protein n=1 Tax=Artemisia annua TaxID=35608 RepID=A0A2U1KHG5_ARTAN|nr:myc-type, basic helix-loop-helix (bHLH) domain-containing protein [Artemisia annua]
MDSSSTFRSMNSNNNLIRQSSSPAGFLSALNSENGFASMRDVDKSIPSSRLNNHISFSSDKSSSSMFLPQIPENRNNMNDSTFRSLKRTRDDDSLTLDKQSGASGQYTPSLIHYMSLPKTSSEMAVAEKLLRFDQDSTPCKTRAKRGCATHPRSIAERMRRTRISDRMKKLQELFPSIDKQTSTSDMLDMAVQHIKDLQKDLQNLKNARSRCTCSCKES